MKLNKHFSVGAIGAVSVFLPASAALADFDISPSVSGSKIVTNAFTDETSAFVANVRVFDFSFDDPTPPLFTQDPGFHPQPGSGFTTASSVRVGAVGGLQYFSGTGPVAFAAVPSGTSLQLQFGSSSLAISNAAPSGTLTLGAADSVGEFDRHLGATLTASGGTPANGIYLVPLQLTDPGLGLTPSDPVYVLYSVNADDAAVESAKEALRDAFAPGTNLAPVPEPASFALAAPVGLALLRRRRGRLDAM